MLCATSQSFHVPVPHKKTKQYLKKKYIYSIKKMWQALSTKIESKTEYTANSCLKKLDNLCPVYNEAAASSQLA